MSPNDYTELKIVEAGADLFFQRRTGIAPADTLEWMKRIGPSETGIAIITVVLFSSSALSTSFSWKEIRKDRERGRVASFSVAENQGWPILQIQVCDVNKSAKGQGFGFNVLSAAACVAEICDAPIQLEATGAGRMYWPHQGAMRHPTLPYHYQWSREQVRDIAAKTREKFTNG
jgi:hypothetical protein